MHEKPGLPYAMPIIISSGHQPQPSLHSNEPPARVQVAMALLRQLTMKTMTQVAANNVAFETVAGQALTDSEEAAQDTACNLLTKYLAGQMPPDFWEKQQAVADGNVILCPRCSHQPRRDCPLCRGAGKLVAFPAGE